MIFFFHVMTRKDFTHTQKKITYAEYEGIGASLDCHCHFGRRL